MSDRIEVRLLGVVLGTAHGWDGDNLTYIFYDFIPEDGINIPRGDVTISYDEGTITKWNAETESDDAVMSLTSIVAFAMRPAHTTHAQSPVDDRTERA